ncbi:DUF7529 family protein [Halocatena salina]|uniref:Uncharacterized protein n=1 Tax=Halocatena salina TaxID=2934340 RepID=A0A8U0A6R2_9EURY|nr:hypothetical protein [Halocatena salina]UPM43617.1 hypothetical protein MW046_04005 [Halocatena salina]
MTESGEDGAHAEQSAATTEEGKSAWQATIDDMNGMAAELEQEGWTATAIAADDTAPNPPEVGDTDRYGFIHVIADNDAEEFSETFERGHEEGGGFPEYEVYQSKSGGQIFQVTVLYDEATANVILLAGNYEPQHAQDLMQAATEREELYTHVQTLDKTVLGSFRHEGWEIFFPNVGQ